MNLDIWQEKPSELVKDHQIGEARQWHWRHQPPLTLPQWRAQRRALLAAIRANAGTFPAPPALEPQVHGVIRLPGYEIRKITYQSRPGMRVTANLYVPDGQGPFPGIIGVHGHHAQGKIAGRVQERGHLLALSGFVVLMIDAFGAGERGSIPGKYEYHGAGIGAGLFDLGETLLGMQVYDNMRGIDLLQSMPSVNADRIGVTGASGGGNQTMWLAALDPRIKAAVPVVSVGTFESYVTRTNCVCEVLPNGLTFMEEWAALGLVAPNALLIVNALRDGPTFCVPEMLRSFNAAGRVYRLYGAEEKLAYQVFDMTHGYWPEMQRCMLGWFKRWLKDEGEGRPCDLPEFQALPEERCLCFPAGRRPKSVVSIPDYCHMAARRIMNDAKDNAGKVSRAAKLRQLQSLLRSRPPVTAAPVEFGTVEEAGLRIRKFAVESEPDILLPAALVTRPAAGAVKTVALILHPSGKAVAVEADWARSAGRRPAARLFADLRGTGETCYNSSQLGEQSYHDQARACFWLGRTMLGDWVCDIQALVRAAAGIFPRARLEIHAFGEAGLAALCAAAFNRRIHSVACVNLQGSYLYQGARSGKSMVIHVPGILRWGDVATLAALPAGNVALLNPVDSEGQSYTAAKCRALEAAIRREARLFRRPARARVSRGVFPAA